MTDRVRSGGACGVDREDRPPQPEGRAERLGDRLRRDHHGVAPVRFPAGELVAQGPLAADQPAVAAAEHDTPPFGGEQRGRRTGGTSSAGGSPGTPGTFGVPDTDAARGHRLLGRDESEVQGRFPAPAQ